jgi:hypothetical protein
MIATQQLKVNQGTVTSYPFNFGTITLNNEYQPITFADTTTYKRLPVTNTSATRASFLRAWHVFRNRGITEIPTTLEYDTKLGDQWYTKVGEKAYTSGVKRLEIYANEPCMVGDNTPAELARPNIKRGFNNLTSSSCYIAVVFRANMNYQNVNMDINLAKTMESNHFKLQYYNNDRSSWDLTFHVHVYGKVLPNGVTAVPNTSAMYQSIQATPTGQATISWQAMPPKNADLGNVVAYRVFWNTSETLLTNILNASTTSFVDVNTNAEGLYTRTITGLTSKVFYFFKIIPIRQYTNYNPLELTNTAPFFNLTGNKYLSDNGIAQLALAIPPTTMFYDPATFSFISREFLTSNLMNFTTAKAECAKTIMAVKLTRNGTAKNYQTRLITEPIWNQIKNRPGESYESVYKYSLWIDKTIPNIHSLLLGYVGYVPSNDSNYLPTSKTYYAKASGCGSNCPGNQAVGTVYHNPDYATWVSLISAGTVFASPRCYVNLAAP